MKLPGGLGRQIALSMIAATVSSVIFAIASLYLFYGIALRVAPELVPLEGAGMLPSSLEWVLIVLLCFVAAGLGAFMAVRLARRIVAPLISVAETARRIADGDIKVRAVPADRSLAEAAMLVDDFNLLADRLERASAGITRWNATIAHELRTPVTILSGRLQGLSDGVFQPEPALLRSLVAHTESLSRLIEDLRTVSLFEGGRLGVSIHPVELGAELDAIVALMRPRLEEAGFTIVTSLNAGRCNADVARIRQAVVALLENVRKHATPGLVRVTLNFHDDTAELTIADSGPGLPPDFARYAFEPFRQYLDGKDDIKGSGLGLAVVRAIAEAHGGTASYRTVAGGACFMLTLPCR